MPQILSGNRLPLSGKHRVFGSSHMINHTVPAPADKKPVLAKQVRQKVSRRCA